MSLNAKDKIVMRKRCNGGREGFEVFQRAVSTWAASRNPHLIRIMEGSAPFEGMSYKDTLGLVPNNLKTSSRSFQLVEAPVDQEAARVESSKSKEARQTRERIQRTRSRLK